MASKYGKMLYIDYFKQKKIPIFRSESKYFVMLE